MNPRVVLILLNVALFCTGCMCPGPGYGPAVCGPQPFRPLACGPTMPLMPRIAAMLPRPLMPGYRASNQFAGQRAYQQAPRFRKDAADWPQAQPCVAPVPYAQRSAWQQPKQPQQQQWDNCGCGECHQKLRLVPRTTHKCSCRTSGCSHGSSCSYCAPPLAPPKPCTTACKGQCRCHSNQSSQSHQSAGTGCTDCYPLPMMGLPHHRPFSESTVPAVTSPVPLPKGNAGANPIDVTTDVAPDILENKSVRDVVPAPVPPADPEPATEPQLRRFDIDDPVVPETRTVPPAEEAPAKPAPALPTDAEDDVGPDPMLVPDIQPIALWIPETQRPVAKPAIKVEPEEIVIVPGTRMASRRIQ